MGALSNAWRPYADAQTRSEPVKRQLLECIDRARNLFGDPVKRWNDRLTLKRNSYIEQYRRGRVALVLDCPVIVPFQFDVAARFIHDEFPRSARVFCPKGDVFIVLKKDLSEYHQIEHWDEQLMFVPDVQIVESAEQRIPSRVGFYNILQEATDRKSATVVGARLLFQSVFKGLFKFFPVISEWESRVMRCAPDRCFDRPEVHEIESAFEVVQSISDDKSGANHREAGFVDVEAKMVLPSLDLNAHGVEVRVRETGEKFVQVRDVLYGPFNLFS